ncbi:MAG: hypothetical protein HY548_07535 [Elusimicrobia bacterium]|nr:hypothetical protein [Elusimicrobiota bacterium]
MSIRFYSTVLLFLFLAGGLANSYAAVKALTRGRFTVRYLLSEEEGRIRARRVKVRVDNSVRFYEPPSRRVREHERVHVRINRAESARMQDSLSRFEAPSRGRPDDLEKAEALFLSKFAAMIQDVERLHADWDASQTFHTAE